MMSTLPLSVTYSLDKVTPYTPITKFKFNESLKSSLEISTKNSVLNEKSGEAKEQFSEDIIDSRTTKCSYSYS